MRQSAPRPAASIQSQRLSHVCQPLSEIMSGMPGEGQLTINNHELSQAELYVARAGWHIDDEDVKVAGWFAPVDVEEKLERG